MLLKAIGGRKITKTKQQQQQKNKEQETGVFHTICKDGCLFPMIVGHSSVLHLDMNRSLNS